MSRVLFSDKHEGKISDVISYTAEVNHKKVDSSGNWIRTFGTPVCKILGGHM